jgi:glycosyltransferase involved in cell wall biosynthesis
MYNGFMNISVVVLTKNEEENIRGCLESVKWANEIIVVDDFSYDKTAKIARSFGAKIYKRKLNNDFSGQRNFAMRKCTKKWILFLDADERISSELAKEITHHPSPITHYQAFRIRRVDYLWGKKLKYGDIRRVNLVRLGEKGAGKWVRRVHEKWEIEGEIGNIKGEILHFPHRNVSHFLKKIRKYALIHARQLQNEGVKANLLQIIFYPLGKFIANYIFKLGFLDSTAGFVHAVMMSFHSFIARSELWLRQDA